MSATHEGPEDRGRHGDGAANGGSGGGGRPPAGQSEGGHPSCPLRDAVIAYFLDGEPPLHGAQGGDAMSGAVAAPSDFTRSTRGADHDDETTAGRDDRPFEHASRLELEEHRDHCDDCRRALRRARRLDAVVAAVEPPQSRAAASLDGDAWTAAETWLDVAIASVATTPVGGSRDPEPSLAVVGAATPGRPEGARWFIGVWIGVAVLAVMLWFATSHRSPEAGVPVEPSPVREAAAALDAPPRRDHPLSAGAEDGHAAGREPVVVLGPAASGLIPWPTNARPALNRLRPPASVETEASLTTSEFVAWCAWPCAWATGGFDGLAARAQRVAESTRDEAARRLVATRSGAEVACRLAVELDAPRVLEPVLRALRGQAAGGFRPTGRLDAPDGRALRLAVRVGGAAVDRRLLAWASADAARIEELAWRLRELPTRPGRADLLLDLASARAGRDGPQDEFARAVRWFGGLGGEDTASVVARLERSSNAEERRRCMLVLAALADPLASVTLVDVLMRPNLSEAAWAAFALGRMPVGSDALADLRVAPRAQPLWFAALASRRDDRARALGAGLALSAAERALIDSGGFSLEQIECVALLFRDRRVRAD